MVTSIKPNFKKDQHQITAIQTKLINNYGFISPASHTNDWDAASDFEKEYAFIGDANNELGTANDPGFVII